jgi:hypothetical protein
VGLTEYVYLSLGARMCDGVVLSKTVFMSLIFQRMINQKNIKTLTFKDCLYRELKGFSTCMACREMCEWVGCREMCEWMGRE